MRLAFSGPRKLTADEEDYCLEIICSLKDDSDWIVGDMTGLDELVRVVAPRMKKHLSIFEVEGNKENWRFAERTKKMVRAADKLIAFPNKSCPDGVFPDGNPSGKGSGTWLAIAYSIYRQIPVELYYIETIKLPSWLKKESASPVQMTLF